MASPINAFAEEKAKVPRDNATNLRCSLSYPHSEQRGVSQLRWESSQNRHKIVSYKVNINENGGKHKTQLRSNKAA